MCEMCVSHAQCNAGDLRALTAWWEQVSLVPRPRFFGWGEARSRWELPLPPTSCEVENKNASTIHTHRATLVSTPSQAGMNLPH